ncbi:sushi, von Willebrand factor type A, EGF and pentraxin domain-containing protein 1-like [Lineus longissimus]|uniref:sushi, von Willebrand factor type A, EGF and pentraxin domain-containing protein 1-like n=1 Tax=Lineus longissimus TaxID=88925 RepID=UPI00315CBCED
MPSMRYSCNSYGRWSVGSLAPCEPRSCKEPPEVKHAVRNSSDRTYPTWIEYECEHGYHYAYDNTSTGVGWCSPDMEWIDVPDDCEPVECQPFPRVGNATLNSANNRYLDNVVWTCITGFMFPDTVISKWISCRENYVNFQIGRWNISKLHDCIPLKCPEPPVPVNTTIVFMSGSPHDTSFRTVLRYSCISDEFEFPDGDDSVRTECGAGAHWVPIVPPCSKIPRKLKLKGKFYVPPPKESPSAKAVGTLALIIMIILVIIMVLMDLGTIHRGCRLARYNLRSRFCPRKKKNRPKTD